MFKIGWSWSYRPIEISQPQWKWNTFVVSGVVVKQDQRILAMRILIAIDCGIVSTILIDKVVKRLVSKTVQYSWTPTTYYCTTTSYSGVATILVVVVEY